MEISEQKRITKAYVIFNCYSYLFPCMYIKDFSLHTQQPTISTFQLEEIIFPIGFLFLSSWVKKSIF